jgi:hypothetical protein
VNVTLCEVNVTPCEMNVTPCEVNVTPCEVNVTPCEVNVTPCRHLREVDPFFKTIYTVSRLLFAFFIVYIIARDSFRAKQ